MSGHVGTWQRLSWGAGASVRLPTAQLDNGSIIEAADATKAQIAEAVMMTAALAAGAALTRGTLVFLIVDEADEV